MTISIVLGLSDQAAATSYIVGRLISLSLLPRGFLSGENTHGVSQEKRQEKR